MVECCHDLHEVHGGDFELMIAESDCPVGSRMGGATVHVEGSCLELDFFAAEEEELPECECTGWQSGSVSGDEMCAFQRGVNCALKSNNPSWVDGCPDNALHCVLKIPEETDGEECMDDDDLASSIMQDAEDMNIHDCDSLQRWGKLNLGDAFSCDTFIATVTDFGMTNERAVNRLREKTMSDICCASCKSTDLCTLDVDTYQSESGNCEAGEESFDFCGKIQCISNPECTFEKLGLDDPDSFICPETPDTETYDRPDDAAMRSLGQLLERNTSASRFDKVGKRVKDILNQSNRNFCPDVKDKLQKMKKLAKRGYTEARWEKMVSLYQKLVDLLA